MDAVAAEGLGTELNEREVAAMAIEDYEYGYEDGRTDAGKGRLLQLEEGTDPDYERGYRDGAAGVEAGT